MAQEGFIGEIRMFAGNFAPRSWALCEGQLLSIAQNTALFSILGTIYGGDGRTTFALPDLRGRAPISSGNGPGLPSYRVGQRSGAATTHLTILNLPSHSHNSIVNIPISGDDATTDEGGGLLSTTDGAKVYGGAAGGSNYNGGNTQVTVGNTGGSQAIDNMQPYLAVNYIIALFGVYPSRS
jgi:microcystin-dependent protein